MQSSNISEHSSKNQIQIINMYNKNDSVAYSFDNISKNLVNYLNNERYIDDKFVLPQNKLSPSIKIKRISQIYPINSSLFIDFKTGNKLKKPTKNKINNQFPNYLSEINMLPYSHYYNLIQPKFVNDQGYYYVVIYKDGALYKEIIDDKFYYDQNKQQIYSHSQLSDCLWVHILVKVWAKINNGYQNLNNPLPFGFIKTFSFPDWQIINPSKQNKQNLINIINKATKKKEYMIAQTKKNPKVGYYGFMTDCASFTVNGHYQQYGQVYVKITSFTNSCWNEIISDSKTKPPQQLPTLNENQFLMPVNQFINIFHFIYCTSNKYYFQVQNTGQMKKNSQFHELHQTPKISQKKHSFNNSNKIDYIHYNRQSISVDARSSNAIVIGFQVQKNSIHTHGDHNQVSLCLHFPKIKVFDIVQNNHIEQNKNAEVIPWSKIIIGSLLDSHQTDVNYVQKVKQKMLYCEQQHMNFVTHQGAHQYVAGEYFKGYTSDLVYNLSLRPGKYLLRVKMQKKMSQYRFFLNTVTINSVTKIFNPKLSSVEQATLLKDCLFKKAALERKFITFVNPAKRGSWISCRNQYQNLGYSYVAVHVVQNADNKIIININPKVLLSAGYIVKGHKHSNQEEYSITVDSDQNTLIVLKYDKQWKGQKRVWPPPGIQFTKFPRKKL